MKKQILLTLLSMLAACCTACQDEGENFSQINTTIRLSAEEPVVIEDIRVMLFDNCGYYVGGIDTQGTQIDLLDYVLTTELNPGYYHIVATVNNRNHYTEHPPELVEGQTHISQVKLITDTKPQTAHLHYGTVLGHRFDPLHDVVTVNVKPTRVLQILFGARVGVNPWNGHETNVEL